MIAEVHRILIEPTISIEDAGLPLGVGRPRFWLRNQGGVKNFSHPNGTAVNGVDFSDAHRLQPPLHASWRSPAWA